MENTVQKEINIITLDDLKKVLNNKKLEMLLIKSGDDTWKKLFDNKTFFRHIISTMDTDLVIRKFKRVATEKQIQNYTREVLDICIRSMDKNIINKWKDTFGEITAETFISLIQITQITEDNEDFISSIIDFVNDFIENRDEIIQIRYAILNMIAILFKQREKKEYDNMDMASNVFDKLLMTLDRIHDLDRGLLMAFYAAFGMTKEFETLRERFFTKHDISVNDAYIIETTGDKEKSFFYSSAKEELNWPINYFEYFTDKTFFHIIMASGDIELIDEYCKNLELDEVVKYMKVYNSDRIVKNYLWMCVRNGTNPFEALTKDGDLKNIYDEIMILTGAKFQTNNDLFIRLITAIAYVNQEPSSFRKMQPMVDNSIYTEEIIRFINQEYTDYRRYIIYYVINSKSLSKSISIYDLNSILSEYIKFNMKNINNYANKKNIRVSENYSYIKKVDKILLTIQKQEMVERFDSLVPVIQDKTMMTLLIIYSIKYDIIAENGEFLRFKEHKRQSILKDYNISDKNSLVNYDDSSSDSSSSDSSSDDDLMEKEFSYGHGSENDYIPVIETKSKTEILLERQNRIREERANMIMNREKHIEAEKERAKNEVVKKQREEEQKRARHDAIRAEKLELREKKKIEKITIERDRLIEENLLARELDKKRMSMVRKRKVTDKVDTAIEPLKQRKTIYVREKSDDDDYLTYDTNDDVQETQTRSSSIGASSNASDFINSDMPSRPAYGGQNISQIQSARPRLLGSSSLQRQTNLRPSEKNRR